MLDNTECTKYGIYIPCSGMLGYALMHCTRILRTDTDTAWTEYVLYFVLCPLDTILVHTHTTRHACMHGVAENKLKGILNPINGA